MRAPQLFHVGILEWTRFSLDLWVGIQWHKSLEAARRIRVGFRLSQLSSSLEHIQCSPGGVPIFVPVHQNMALNDRNVAGECGSGDLH